MSGFRGQVVGGGNPIIVLPGIFNHDNEEIMSTKSNRLFALLKGDHKVLKTLFLEYDRADLGKQLAIAQTVVQELDIHAELEEQLIYPAIRQAVDEDDLMNEASEEHHLMHVLIKELFHLRPTQDTFQTKFKVLGDVALRHIKEEEGKMFPVA
jgi:hemerythrin superfamily protein